MHGEKRKTCDETFAQVPMVSHNRHAKVVPDSGGGKSTPVSVAHTNASLALSVAIIPGDSIPSGKQPALADGGSSCAMVSSAGLSRIDSICAECDGHVYDSNGNITARKKRQPTEVRSEPKKVEAKHQVYLNRSRPRKEPLPMKLRALPQSFWQQPNNTPSQSPGTMCPVLPLLCKEEVAECISTDTRTALHAEEAPTTSCHKEVVSDANTDLLFSLFRVVEDEQRRSQGESTATVVRRGRPKKPPRGALKDDDPCLVSTVTESLLPLLPERPARDAHTRTPQGPQALAVVAVHGERPPRAPVTPASTSTAAVTGQNYSHLLSEVVFRL